MKNATENANHRSALPKMPWKSAVQKHHTFNAFEKTAEMRDGNAPRKQNVTVWKKFADPRNIITHHSTNAETRP